MTEDNLQSTKPKLTKRLRHIHKSTRNIQVVNVFLIAAWLTLAYSIIYKPIVNGGKATPKIADSATEDMPIESTVKLMSSDTSTELSDLEAGTIDTGAVQTSYDYILEQNRNLNFPFYSQLPYQSEKFLIDLPTDNGTLQIFVNGNNNKQAAMDWLKANGADATALDINWVVR